MRRPQFAIATALTLCTLTSRAWGLGEETLGNAPLNGANYTEWPGILPVVNDKDRVYHSWVNGNEHFYYRSGVKGVNRALKAFAAVAVPVHEVVLRPAPGLARTFDQQAIPCTWQLHVNGGISKHLTTIDQGEKVWSRHPRLTVYIGGDVTLDELEFPENLSLVGLAELKARCVEAIDKSDDQTVRGWGTGELAALDPYDTETADEVAKRLADKDNWVRLNAAGALAHYGKRAESALPALREALDTEDANLKQRIEQTIKTIESAEDPADAAKAHDETLAKIEELLKERSYKKE